MHLLLSPPTPPAAQIGAHRLSARANTSLRLSNALIDRADFRAPVRGRSRSLCAGLGVLAEDAYTALGGRNHREAVGHTAALLSLLTKIDDEVIDARLFHRGPLRTAGHATLRDKTRRYLAPTLDSLIAAQPVSSDPRCIVAAVVGRSLRRLAADPARLQSLHAVIARGWEVQVRAVDILSRHPAETTLADVARVTAQISGDWLLMITMIGGLPADAARMLSDAEQQAFVGWGWHIQRADALSDFGKDHLAGLANSWAGRTLYARAGGSYLRATERFELPTLYAMLESHAVADACKPSSATALDRCGRQLAALGSVPQWLAWIQAMLVQRYDDHATSGRGA